MQIVHSDNRFITADCDSGKGQASPLDRERPTSTNLQLSDRNTELVLSRRWMLYSKTDWPTDSRS
jgi:hypothetical protein